MRGVISLMIGGAMLASQPVLAQDAAVFEPDTAWAMDYGDDYCRLMRDYTNGDDTISLFFERIQPGPTFRLFVVGDSVRLFRGTQQVGYRLLPSGAPRMAQRLSFEGATGQQFLNLGPIMLAEFAPPAPGAPPAPPAPYSREGEQAVAENINGLMLTDGLVNPVRINTGDLDAPFEALQACADDMLQFWGVDPAAHQSLTRGVAPGDGVFRTGENGFPVNPSAGWISQNTVGFEDFALLSGGNNEIRVMVNAQGEATDCAVHFPTLSASTNESICAQVLANGEFQPALDADGNPIDSYWITNVFALTPPFGG